MTVKPRWADYLKIALKSIFRHNRANQFVLLCLVVLSLIPIMLYNIAYSTLNQIKESHRLVFGEFTDIYYERVETKTPELNLSNDEIRDIIPKFRYSAYGVITTIATFEQNDMKTLRLGYADEVALDLAVIELVEGNMPNVIGEIALTLGMAAELQAEQIGDEVDIAGARYRVSGLIRDFGNLWPIPKEMQNIDFGATNALVSEMEAQRLLQENPTVTRQILFIRDSNSLNPTDVPSSLMRNINSSLNQNSEFQIPLQFISLMTLVAFLPIVFIFVLNKKRLTERIRTYHQLGLNAQAIKSILRIEHSVLTLAGVTGGLGFSMILAPIVLRYISSYAGMEISFSVNWMFLAILLLAIFSGNLLINNLFCQSDLKAALSDEIDQIARIPTSAGRINPLRYALHINRVGLSLVLIVITLLYSCIAYGLFYGNVYHRNLYDQYPGQLPKDYDFLFHSAVEPAEPYTGEYRPFYFTNTYEDLGGDLEFIKTLNELPAVERVLAYQENDKLNVLLKTNQLDDYIDGNDTSLDGHYNMMLQTRISDLETFYRLYRYEADEMLVSASVISYPETVLQDLAKHVSEGQINLARLASGEEIILRVPAYRLRHDDVNNIKIIEPLGKDHPEALNSRTFQVGDTLVLSGLVNKDGLSGAIIEDQADSFERIDVEVKVGAIIREAYGMLPQAGTFLDTFSILTINGALERLRVDAKYSNIAVFTNPDYSDKSAREMILGLTPLLPNMRVIDLQAENQSLRILNLLTRLFTMSFLTAIILAALIILISQLSAHVRLNQKNYSLLRVNGLSLTRLVRSWLLQLLSLSCLGSLAGAILALLWMQSTRHFSPPNILSQILWYFPLTSFALVFMVILIIMAVVTLPGLLILLRSRTEIFLD